eukprot:g48312.t1
MGDCCLKMWLALLLGLQLIVALVWGNTTTDLCEKMCSCTEVEGVLHIDCERRGISDLQHYSAPTSRFYQLFLHRNSLSKLFPNEFANFYNAVTLHLENNGLHDIIPGAFLGLQLLKRLHINNNKIKGFRRHTFLGLDDMEYLQADFNLLRDIDPGAFHDLNELEVLILNDNLLSSLPPDLFQNVPITHLDLRGNRLKTLPYDGILELIPGVAEILLEDNPWDCTCDLLPLKVLMLFSHIQWLLWLLLEGMLYAEQQRRRWCMSKRAMSAGFVEKGGYRWGGVMLILDNIMKYWKDSEHFPCLQSSFCQLVSTETGDIWYVPEDFLADMSKFKFTLGNSMVRWALNCAVELLTFSSIVPTMYLSLVKFKIMSLLRINIGYVEAETRNLR